LRILFLGTPNIAAEHLIALSKDQSHSVVGVITQPDKPQGRGLALGKPPVKTTAETLGIGPILQPESLKNPEIAQACAALHPDIGIVVAYGKIIPPSILLIPKFGFINAHFSLLPQLRGASPIESAILHGLAQTGVTIFKLNEKMDEGPIIKQAGGDIAPTETTPQLRHKLTALSIALIQKSLATIAENPNAGIPQNHSQATYCKPILKEAGQISWEDAAAVAERKVRAFIEWPKAYGHILGKRVIVLKAQALPENSNTAKTGAVTRVEQGRGFVIKCKEGSLLIEEVHPEGKKAMKALDFLRGIPGGWNKSE